jgi:hypothetical protein
MRLVDLVAARLLGLLVGIVVALLGPLNLSAQGIDEYLLNSTVLIKRNVGPDTQSLGTGFLVLRQIARDEKTYRTSYQVVIVTNKHVLPPEHTAFRQISVKIAIRDGSSVKTKEVPVDILGRDGKFRDIIAMHPDPKVDVAAVNITSIISKEPSQWLLDALETHKGFTTDVLLPTSRFKDAQVGIGTEIYLVGYPNGFSDPRNISPIARLGIISTEPDKGYSFDQQTNSQFNLPMSIPGFLIDANVFPGSSGSMIVRRTRTVPGFEPGGQASIQYVLGIVADSMPIHDTALNSTQRMGLGVVFNSDTILETIAQLPKVSGAE